MTSYKKWWLAPQKPGNQAPMPFEIPEGYKSPFNDLEVGLNELWMGQKKFLRQFHKEKKSHKEIISENSSGYHFNNSGDGIKDGSQVGEPSGDVGGIVTDSEYHE